MAVHKLTNAAIWIAQYDVSSDHNAVALENDVESLDDTVFGDTTRSSLGGLYAAAANGQGLLSYNTADIEAILSATFNTPDTPITVSGTGAAAGERAHFARFLKVKIAPVGGAVGDLHAFQWAASGSGGTPLVPGTVMAAKAARTTSSNSGTALQLGAVSAAQRVYAALHVFAASGTSPTLAVTVKSDNGVGFGTPATQITFTTATAAGSQFSSAAGAITDDYWRVDWTVGGTSPSFTFAVVIGIF